MTCNPMWPFLLMCVSRDTSRTTFPQVDELSTRHPGFGASHIFMLKGTLFTLPFVPVWLAELIQS